MSLLRVDYSDIFELCPPLFLCDFDLWSKFRDGRS